MSYTLTIELWAVERLSPQDIDELSEEVRPKRVSALEAEVCIDAAF